MSAESLTVALVWKIPAQEMPDSDLTVLLCAPSASEPVWPGYHDGACWRDGDGMRLVETVVAWADLPTCPLAGGGA